MTLLFLTTSKYYILWRDLGCLVSLICMDIVITSIFVFFQTAKITTLLLLFLYLYKSISD